MSEPKVYYDFPYCWFWVGKPMEVYFSYLKSILPERYIIEPKVNGWRVLVYCEGKDSLIMTRHKSLISKDKCPKIYEAICGLPRGYIFDGEILHQEGYQRLYLFDCLVADGSELLLCPIEVRKQSLDIVKGRIGIEVLAHIPFIEDLPAYYANIYRLCYIEKTDGIKDIFRVEGLVFKRRDSVYPLGISETRNKTNLWLKIRFDSAKPSESYQVKSALNNK